MVTAEGAHIKKQLAVGLLISVITLIVILGGIELVAYFWENHLAQGPNGWTLVASRRMDLQARGTFEQPFFLYEPSSDYMWEEIPVHINSLGLRTDEFTYPKPADTYRILNLGDSIVFGWEVDQRDTYGKRLEEMLNDRNDGRVYEVINAGIPAWNLESERNYLLNEGLDLSPDLVILDVTVVNDIGAIGSPISEDYGFFDWLRDETYSWPFITTQARFLMSGTRGPEAIPVLNPPRNAEEYFPLSEDDPAYDLTWEYIAEMNTALKDKGIDLIVIIFPTAFQLNSENHPDIPQRSLRRWTEETGVKFIDMLPIYRIACAEAQPDSCEGYENHIFADVWMHPNPLGHQLAADALNKLISSTSHE